MSEFSRYNRCLDVLKELMELNRAVPKYAAADRSCNVIVERSNYSRDGVPNRWVFQFDKGVEGSCFHTIIELTGNNREVIYDEGLSPVFMKYLEAVIDAAKVLGYVEILHPNKKSFTFGMYAS